MDFDLKDKYIGRYRIDELLGAGSMAHVYKAYDGEINRTVAIKVLKKNNCLDKEYYNRFLSEAKAAGFLSHPNIVTIYDVGTYEDTPYIVMELIEGKTLGDMLEEKQTFDIKQTLRMMMQLVHALDYAHSKGIVHRDVKPDNIIFMPDGDTVKLTDFGIAHRDDSTASEKTQAGTLLGTPRYMSPEQALGEKLDGRSDLFSVGVLLYEMLTGEKAFKSKSMITLITQITQQQPELLGKLPDEIPAGLQHLLKRLLEKKPAKRPKSGAEVAEVLQWELDALYEQEEQKSRNKYMPMHIKWTLIMSSIITLVLASCIFIVLKIQSQKLTEYAVDSGVSLAQFIASESAIPVLGEDWVSLESLVKDASERQTFEYLIIQDHSGIVRAAMQPELIGQPMKEFQITGTLFNNEEVLVTSLLTQGEQQVFNFQTPIYFHGTNVGRIQLGLQQNSLEQIKKVSTGLLLSVGGVTLMSVVVVIFIFGSFIAIQLRILHRAMVDFKAGSLDRRISQTRSDEIGDVFQLFNEIADKVQNDMVPRQHIAEPVIQELQETSTDTTAEDSSEEVAESVEPDEAITSEEPEIPAINTEQTEPDDTELEKEIEVKAELAEEGTVIGELTTETGQAEPSPVTGEEISDETDGTTIQPKS
ncbi:protein kinase [Vibrio sp. JC009]|uniref:serine/threonine protein kinase n=1 Tax=Vibrio sp. JC009 TaxID=2912314 RepID=UPI0023AEB036|nr:serine/threonine-protein kinase [Vibrio sp. JC009]WED22962.1 protein kinase [Vibrio sp. JC009]